MSSSPSPITQKIVGSPGEGSGPVLPKHQRDPNEQPKPKERPDSGQTIKRSPIKAVQSLLVRNEGSTVAGPEFLARVQEQVKVAGGTLALLQAYLARVDGGGPSRPVAASNSSLDDRGSFLLLCQALTFVVADDRQRNTAVKNSALKALLLGLRAYTIADDRECLRVRSIPADSSLRLF